MNSGFSRILRLKGAGVLQKFDDYCIIKDRHAAARRSSDSIPNGVSQDYRDSLDVLLIITSKCRDRC